MLFLSLIIIIRSPVMHFSQIWPPSPILGAIFGFGYVLGHFGGQICCFWFRLNFSNFFQLSTVGSLCDDGGVCDDWAHLNIWGGDDVWVVTTFVWTLTARNAVQLCNQRWRRGTNTNTNARGLAFCCEQLSIQNWMWMWIYIYCQNILGFVWCWLIKT